MFSGSVNRWGEFFLPCCNSYCLVLLKIKSRRDSLCGNVRKKRNIFYALFFFLLFIYVFLNRRSGFLDVRNQTMYCSPKNKAYTLACKSTRDLWTINHLAPVFEHQIRLTKHNTFCYSGLIVTRDNICPCNGIKTQPMLVNQSVGINLTLSPLP